MIFTADSPHGPLTLAATRDGALVYLGFHDREPRPRIPAQLLASGELTEDPALLVPVRQQLEEYFRGTRRTFDVPLAPRGTPFQLRVWAELVKIPYGTTISYGELARRLGDPNLTRAVGAANGANPISILVPCHRVIGTNGSLVGYAGGLDLKRALLELEQDEPFPGWVKA
jgi:methylated-DNA-[protein]-cysteine S-methyltransferase